VVASRTRESPDKTTRKHREKMPRKARRRSPDRALGAGPPPDRAAPPAPAPAWTPQHRPPPAGGPVDAGAVVLWGDRLGRLGGSVVAAALVVAIARATALDAYVPADLSGEMLRWPQYVRGRPRRHGPAGGRGRRPGRGIRAAVLRAVVVDVC
jgi:hypothetical protein